MVKPAFLSKEHYLRQADELIVGVCTVREVERALGRSLSSAHKLGLGNHVALLGEVLQVLLDASALLDGAVTMLTTTERKIR